MLEKLSNLSLVLEEAEENKHKQISNHVWFLRNLRKGNLSSLTIFSILVFYFFPVKNIQ